MDVLHTSVSVPVRDFLTQQDQYHPFLAKGKRRTLYTGNLISQDAAHR